MGMFDFVEDIGEGLGDIAEGAVEGLGDGLEAIGDGVGEAGEWLAGAAGDAGAGLGAVVDWGASALDDASFGVFGDTMNFADDYLFDTVDYLTGGVVDVDFDGGALSASVGIEGIMSAGASIGEHGVEGSYDTVVAGAGVGLTDQGFNVNSSAGIDWGPLPHAEGHIDLGADGTVNIGGEAQGTIPTPIGFVSGDVEGGFSRTPDGAWAGNVSLDGQLTLPSGTYVGGTFDVAHQQTADGDSITSVGAGGRVGQYGVGEVGVEGQYTHAEVDGVTFDSVSGSATASGYGFEAGVEGGYQRVEAGGNVVENASFGGHINGYGESIEAEANYRGGVVGGKEFSDWSADASTTFDGERLVGLSQTLFGDQAGDLAGGMGLPDSADALVGMLGSGGTGDLLGQLGGGDLAGFVDSLGVDGATDLAGKLISDGNFGSLLGGDGSAAKALLGKVAEAGGLEDVVGQLDAGTAANLIGTLTAPAPAPAVRAVDAIVDDALGVAAQTATDLATGAVAPDAAAAQLTDAVAAVAPADAIVSADVTADVVMTGDTVAVDATAEVTVEVPPAEPVDTFTQQVSAAEQVDDTAVDDLFEGL